MWTVRIIQSGKVVVNDSIMHIPPKLHKINIVRLEDLATEVNALGIDMRCISIIELENNEAV